MASLFGRLRQQLFPSYLGVDIGTTSIKVVEVKQGSKLPRIANYAFEESTGHLLRANQVLQTSSLKIFEDEVVTLLKTVLNTMKPTTDVVVASIPSFTAFMTVLDFPEMAPGELEKSMTYQARQYIPLPISEVAIDWLKVGEFTDDKGFKHQQVLLISVPQEQIRRYQNIFKMAGLRLQALEVESLSLVRAIVGADQTPTMVVDIGSRSTNISFARAGQLAYNAQTDYASSSLTQALASALNMNPLRAEELKKERGIVGTGPSAELSTIILPFLDVILGEVKKAYYNYRNLFPASPNIERVLLSGGGANLLGLEAYVKDQMQLPTAKAASFYRFEYDSALEPLVSELSPIFSVALGVALRQFS